MFSKPLIVDRDGILRIVNQIDNDDAIEQIVKISDTVKVPQGVSTYSVTRYSVWSAMAKGMTVEEILQILESHAYNAVPEKLKQTIRSDAAMYSVFTLTKTDEKLVI